MQPKQVREDAKLLEEYQSILRQNFRLLLRWPVYEGRRGPLLHQNAVDTLEDVTRFR